MKNTASKGHWYNPFSFAMEQVSHPMIKKYIQLARLPNAFTSPSNVIAGYFTITSINNLNLSDLSTLMLSSALFYMSGVIFNDYFDFNVDKIERPSRPLPSGTTSRKKALVIASALMISANILAFTVSNSSLLIGLLLSCVILAYNCKLKLNKFSGPVAMGGARFANVLLGASPALSLLHQPSLLPTIFVATSMLAYAYTITALSRKETTGFRSRSHINAIFLSVFTIVGLIAISPYFHLFTTWVFVTLIPFAIIMAFIFKSTTVGDPASIQKAIKNMILSVVVLDSVFVSGCAGITYGLLTLILLVPAILLSRRFYVT